jgi:hypothetical protein
MPSAMISSSVLRHHIILFSLGHNQCLGSWRSLGSAQTFELVIPRNYRFNFQPFLFDSYRKKRLTASPIISSELAPYESRALVAMVIVRTQVEARSRQRSVVSGQWKSMRGFFHIYDIILFIFCKAEMRYLQWM